VLVGARTIGLIAILLVGPLAAFGAERSRPASPDCPNTAWNLNQEVALFKGAATSTPAGLAVADAPRLELSKLYQVSLTPVDRVTFAASAKPSQRHDASAGILAVEIPTSGNYRVSMDGPFWVEAVGPDGPIASTGFQGRQVCSMIHKIVEFPLLPGHTTLQISGASSTVKLAVTPSANAGERGASR
jgi:hypothetical protein